MAIPSYALKLYADNNKTKFPHKQHPEQDQVPVWDDLAQEYVPGPLPSHAHEASDIANSGATVDQVLAWNGSAWVPVTLAKPNLIKAVTARNPTASSEGTGFFTADALTISQLTAVLVGSASPQVTWTLRHSTDRSATGNEVITAGSVTTNTSTGHVLVSFNDATVPASSFVWLEIAGVSGTVDEFHLSIEYTLD